MCSTSLDFQVQCILNFDDTRLEKDEEWAGCTPSTDRSYTMRFHTELSDTYDDDDT